MNLKTAGPRWFLVLLTSAFLVCGGEAARLPDRFDIEAIDRWLADQVGQSSRVGLSVAIVKNGEWMLARGYGKSSLEKNLPVETNTLFAIGSVTKQFTCACVLLLAEEGKLSVDDPVAKWFPDLTRAKDIRLLDLMNHVSGYPDYYPLDFVDRRMERPISPDQLLSEYAGGKLDFEPGSNWSYSNTGYTLLGRVVERVSGEPFGRFLSRRIFEPLGMKDTVYEPHAGDSRLARGYTTFALSPPEPAVPEASGWIGAAGGIYSTPLDLAKWDFALITGKVLKPESLELMTRNRKLADGRFAGYGCGLSVSTQNGRTVWSHDGGVSGFNAVNMMVPSTKSVLVMTCNVDGGVGTMARDILDLLLRRPAAVPAVNGPPASETVSAVFADLQKGKADRRLFSEDFNRYLTPERVLGAAGRLKRFGKTTRAELLRSAERGGLEVTRTRLTFSRGALTVLMYRNPDGLIEQYFVSPE